MAVYIVRVVMVAVVVVLVVVVLAEFGVALLVLAQFITCRGVAHEIPR